LTVNLCNLLRKAWKALKAFILLKAGEDLQVDVETEEQ